MKSYSKKPLIVNLFGGPGSGKSTTCAGIFHLLKLKGFNCEMALEYAKDKVWEESYKTLENQIYIFGHQLHRIFRLKDKVDIIITDSPLVLSLFYDKERSVNLKNLVLEEFHKYNNLNILIERNETEKYNSSGRYQSFEEAKDIDFQLRKLLIENDIGLFGFKKGQSEEIVDLILDIIDNRSVHPITNENASLLCELKQSVDIVNLVKKGEIKVQPAKELIVQIVKE